MKGIPSKSKTEPLIRYNGVVKPEHVVMYGPTDGHMILCLLTDPHSLEAYWPVYIKNGKGTIYVRGEFQEIPEHLLGKVFAAREYQSLSSHEGIVAETLGLLEL